MENNTFTPGSHIKLFTSKNGRDVILRFVSLSDVPQLTSYINILSKEDIYTGWSGEQLTENEETSHISAIIDEMKTGNKAMVLAFSGDELIGVSDITRGARRSKHVGVVNITIKIGYREEGIGSLLMQELFQIALQMNLQFLELVVYHPNEVAIHVYTKLGFVEVGRIPKKAHYRGEFIDEVIMYKEL